MLVDDGNLIVFSKDLELGLRYSLHLSESQARQLLEATPGEEFRLGIDGWWILVRDTTLLVRQGSNPTLLDKADVFAQISADLCPTR